MRIKLRKAFKLVNLTPTQKEHILKNIPTAAIDRLTSKELAELMMAMHTHYHQGKNESIAEISQHIGVPKGTSIWEIEI